VTSSAQVKEDGLAIAREASMDAKTRAVTAAPRTSSDLRLNPPAEVIYAQPL